MTKDKIAWDIILNPEFQKLQFIGGGQEYHQEGSAFVHSLLVFHNSYEFFETTMNYIALLHDIGKIYTGRQKPNGDWEYPNHAKVGAEHLEEFLPDALKHSWFIDPAKFYITNHIKPLFWETKGYPERTPENINLAKLAICDLKGSISRESQEDKIYKLYCFIDPDIANCPKVELFSH